MTDVRSGGEEGGSDVSGRRYKCLKTRQACAKQELGV
jgi:hypothetical protein